MVAGPLKDLPRASKYLRQAMTSRLNNKRAATLLQALRVDLEQNLGLGPSESELAEVLRKNVVTSHIQRFQLQSTTTVIGQEKHEKWATYRGISYESC